MLGAFATFTNVSAQRYGEGLFNKGIYLSIPTDIFFHRSTISMAKFYWNPLTRDGGQMLARHYAIYEFTVSIRGLK